MSRRQRGSRRTQYRPTSSPRSTAWSDGPPAPADPRPSLQEQLEEATVPALALLPLRFFFGITFVYAGFDKLIDPTFFDSANPASIYGQMTDFIRVSPLAPLVKMAQPFAFEIGLLIAVAEIAIGLGALSGLAFRLSALGGAALSLMFWLTASWTTTPYYYGPDLPYAIGWITLALAGDGGLLVHHSIRELGAWVNEDWLNVPYDGWSRRGIEVEASPMRRTMLQIGTLGAFAVALSSLAIPLRFLRPGASDAAAYGLGGNGNGVFQQPAGNGGNLSDGGGSAAGSSVAPVASSSPSQAAGGGSSRSGAGSGAAGGVQLTTTQAVDRHGATEVAIPYNAPSPYIGGDPAIIVRLASGKYVAYDATCTHQGCPVGWDSRDQVFLCPCHGAAFDPANNGAVLGGPARRPLTKLPIVIDKQAGTISLQA
jgi:thiosulfate dehydrogenase (quinone) large subunit